MQPLATHLAEQIGPDDTLYRQVALRLAELIEHGTLRAGERVPSMRRLSTQEKISIATVTQAYRLLESQGWLEARPQSGYYVRPRPFVAPPEPELTRPAARATRVSVGELVMQIVQAMGNTELVRLGAACPDPSLMPSRELSRIMAAIGRRSPDLGNSYDVPPGVLALRKQIARRTLEAGCTLAPDDIVTTCGAMEALNLCLRAVAQPGDTIAIESPAYFGFLQIIESLGMKACEVPTFPREGVCLVDLEKRLDCCDITACMFSTNFSNPLGSLMPDEKKKALVELLAARDIPLIEDDLYGDLAFAPQRPKAAKAFDKKGLVLLCSSFSKTIAPGYRVGWAAPGRYQAKVEHLKFVNTNSNAMLPQLAVAEFLALGGYDRHLRRVRKL
ncbi:MAG TPA: PLP-dependent aminotransferase family protein, partial [Verrucomicrobiae bacterium]